MAEPHISMTNLFNSSLCEKALSFCPSVWTVPHPGICLGICLALCRTSVCLYRVMFIGQVKHGVFASQRSYTVLAVSLF